MSFDEIFDVRKLESPGYIAWLVCVILRLAVSVEHRLVTDGRKDRQTDTQQQLIPALASVARVKTKKEQRKRLNGHSSDTKIR